MRKEFRLATAQAVSLLCKKMESSIVIYADTI